MAEKQKKQFIDSLGGQELVKGFLQAMATALASYVKTEELTDEIESLFEVDYNKGEKKVYFKMGETSIGEIDVTDFMLDKAVEDVEVTPGSGDNNGKTVLKISWNTDAGNKTVEIPLEKIFNPENYYNKTDADNTFVKKTDYNKDKTALEEAIEDIKDAVGLGEEEGSGESLKDRIEALEEDIEKCLTEEDIEAIPVATIQGWFNQQG